MNRRRFIAPVWFSLFFVATLSSNAQVQGVSRTRMRESSLPIVFEPAPPLEHSSIAIIGRVAGGIVEFRPSEIGVLPADDETDGLRINFDGARRTIPKGTDLEQSQTNYLLGNDPARWRTHVSNYAKVLYPSLYPGINAIFHGNGDHLEHDFVVEPGSDYRQIRMHFPDLSRIHVTKDGTLIVTIAGNSLRMAAPSVYQIEGGKKVHRNGAFRILPNGDVGFVVGIYDPRLELVIDPVLMFSTYLSPLGTDGIAIATDSIGNSYVTGYGTLGYPVTAGAFSGCGSCTTNSTVTFVSKLSADGSKLLYSTVLGGNSFAQPTSIAVDGNGDAIVSGWTAATDFPTKSSQPILPQANNYVGFLVSLSPDGASLNYGTLLGPSPTAPTASMTYATAVAVDSAGNAYVTGETGEGFFVSSGALNQAVTGSFNIYLAKFDVAGALLYSAVLGTADPQNGGAGPIGAFAITVDTAGAVYVTGQAGTLWPITSGAYLSQIAGPMPYADPFVMKVAPDAKSVIYSTYLDYAYLISGISVLANGNVFVVGNDAGATYPTTPEAYESNNGNGTSFLTELNANGSAIVYSTMVCGGPCTLNGMALDQDGNIWLAAQTNNAAFPLLTPLQSTFPTGPLGPGSTSALIEFDPTGQTLKFSTFLGGMTPSFANSVAVDANHRIHISGAAEYGMYTTPGTYAGSVPPPGQGYADSTYAYVASVDPTIPSPGLCVAPNTGLEFGSVAVGVTGDRKLTITSCGGVPLAITGASTTSSDFTVPVPQNGCIGTFSVGQSCTLDLEFAPSVFNPESAILTIASNSPIPAELYLSGTGTTAPILTLSATSLAFGPQLVGTESAPQTITLSNTGNGSLLGVSFGLLATYGPVFPLTSSCGAPLGPGASCIFSVAFKPTSTGTTTTTLIVLNASGLPSQQVTLTGSSPQSPFQIGPQTGGNMTSTVAAGSTATYALQINPAGGYSGSVILACSGIPANASCTFGPSTLTLAGGAPANFTLSISTELTQKASLLRIAGLGLALGGFLFLLPSKRNRAGTVALICFGVLLLVTSISACGGASASSPAPQISKVAPGTYTINVTATDASANQETQSITLVVH